MKAFLSLTALGFALGASAQTTTPTEAPSTPTPPTVVVSNGPLKIGYTNVQYLLAASPQTKVIKSQLETASKQYERVIQEKMAELDEKFNAYQKNEATMMEAIKQDKQTELRSLETSIRSLQEKAGEELKQKENDLVKPELDKIYAAINDVAKENNYTFVLNSDQVVLYAATGTEVTSLVLKKLGYPEPKDEPDAKPAASKTPAPSGHNAKPAPKQGNAPSPSGKKKN
jgi:outer membrane protein